MYRWYVINTYSGHENEVKTNLEQRVRTSPWRRAFREVYVPEEQVTETDKDGKKVQKTQRKLPGYVLVHMDLSDKNAWALVRDTPGVTGFVGAGNQPHPLNASEVASIMDKAGAETAPTAAAAAAAASQPEIIFELGETVRVMSGPLSDFDGEITEINAEQQKLKVLVSIFERQVPVELPYDQVQKV
jgi:transcription termination/antitermination protein NusG